MNAAVTRTTASVQKSVCCIICFGGRWRVFVAEDIKRKLKERKIRNVHFSIDVDSIDPRFAPGTGTRVCEGLMPDEFNNFVDHMLSTNLIKSMDLVELNPELDVNEQTTSLCLQIIDYITARL